MEEEVLKNKKLNAMGTASIPRIIMQFSVPAIISMLVEALYNIVDRYFVGQGVGSLGIGGITICFPISLFIMAMSMMVGVGGNTLFAIRLGERKYQQAAIILNNSFVLLIIMAVGSFTLGQIFMVPLLKLFGASDQLLPVASSYMRIILCGAIFQTIVPGMNHFIRSMGHPKTAMTRVMIGAGSNVFLDWLFIMKLHWGIEGAAWATVLSQLIGGLAVMQFFVKKSTPIKVNRRFMKLRFPYVRKILILGLPPSIMQISNSLLNAIMARSLTTYGTQDLPVVNNMGGGDQAISAFGILMSIVSIVILPLMGFIHGSQPIIGYNYGAKNNNRVRDALKFTMLYATCFIVIAWVLIMTQTMTFVAPFVPKDENMQQLTCKALCTFVALLPFVPLGMVSGNFFQGTGKAWRSMFLNACRQIILLIPFLLIMPRFFGLRGVFMAQPIADIGTAFIAVFMLRLELKKIPRE
ncbi:MAG: MATE family efflux transporter [Fibrobacter sp.]|nr:MATE family efflux transporter [Fibrobacter sp.]